LQHVGEVLALGLYTPAAHEDVNLFLWADDCTEFGRWQLPLVDPIHPAVLNLPFPEAPLGGLSLVALTSDGVLLGGVQPKDCLPPVATIQSLPTFVTTSTFTVTWRGDDVWSGVVGYDVQYRAGFDGSWVNWITHTAVLSASFEGVHGQTYFFRARARDSAGNLGDFGSEEWGQAFTSVLLMPSPVLVTSRKLVKPLAPSVDQLVTHTVLVSNTGNLLATALALTDLLPVTLAVVSGSLSVNGKGAVIVSGGVITWRGLLPPGQEFRLTYALRASQATSLGVPLTNTIWLAADGIAPFVRRAVIVYHRSVFLPLVVKRSQT
jgi:uncharacterized repeat protein (TIGR01451 family)